MSPNLVLSLLRVQRKQLNNPYASKIDQFEKETFHEAKKYVLYVIIEVIFSKNRQISIQLLKGTKLQTDFLDFHRL